MMRQSVLAVLLTLAACAPKEVPPPAAPATPQEVVFTSTDFAFTGPDTIAPGMTTIRLVNTGAQDHHLILGRLDEGKTVADLQQLMAANPEAEPAWFKFVGSNGAVATGDSTASTADLLPGAYVLICFLPDPTDHKMHVEKGMIRTLIVTGEANTAAAPTADIELKMSDFSYDVPAITAGTHTFHLVNDGPQTHEAQLVRLDDGKTLKDLEAAFAPNAKGPPPGRAMGGAGALSAGKSNYWTVTLTPGTYAFLCMVPDSASGTPHLMKGMAKEFTVAAAQ